MTWLPRQITFGLEFFSTIRENGKYYVDKTALVDEIENYGKGHVLLFTRPRRFGKTMSMTMLDSYFNQNYKGNNWFDGLKISELRPDDPEKNSNIVIFMTMKDLGTGSFQSMLTLLRRIVARECRHAFPWETVKGMSPDLREMYDRIMQYPPVKEDLETSVADLCELIHEFYGKDPIILIDEYDNLMNHSFGKPDHRKIVDFMRSFFSSALKTNPYFKFAVLTGIMKVSKESIFSGLTNLVVSDVLTVDPEGSSEEFYGFTPEEVRKLFEDMGAPEKFEEAKEWYDGYRFGDTEIYSPWSVMGYASSGFQPKPYWINTSDNSVIGDMLECSDDIVYQNLGKLCSGEEIETDLDVNVSYGELRDNAAALYSVMVMTGYLTTVRSGSRYKVHIPNKEIFDVFGKEILNKLKPGAGYKTEVLFDSLISGDAEKVRSSLTNLMDVLSVRILSSERVYQAYIAGLMSIYRGRYEVTADYEAGKGYYDIRMKSLGKRPNVLIEIKRRNKNNAGTSMDKLSENALQQIIDKEYARGLKGPTMAYGVAFDQKDAFVSHREI